jgi:beta-lactamase class A
LDFFYLGEILRTKRTFSALRLLALALLFLAVALAAIQLVQFSRVRRFLPAGLKIAGVPVGGLDREQAATRLLEAYSVPVELYYKDNLIHLNPAVIGFKLQIDDMLAVADLERTQKEFWQDYWDFLWGRTTFPTQIPISASFSEPRLQAFMEDISKRYDQPAEPALPIPGTVNFMPGKPGTELDIENSMLLIESALYSLNGRTVNLPLKSITPIKPEFQNLEVLLKQTIELDGFEGIAGIYLLDLQTGHEILFGYQKGDDIPVNPDIAFTASSTIKIPIMVSAYRHMEDEQDNETMKLLRDMIDKSGNEAADWLMDRVIDPDRGPLIVTEDMRALGLENTFLAGYFELGSPLLEVIETPANQRTDISTDPDLYNQTTTSDLGMLLTDIYQCAQTGGGTLTAVFPEKIKQSECQEMITHLINNRLPVLLTAGLPEGTPIAHKHGWVTYNGVINTIGDAGIIYTPSGNYVMVVFLYHPDQLIWDPASTLIAELSQAVYNFYNVPIE